jgi:hypothetical protein
MIRAARDLRETARWWRLVVSKPLYEVSTMKQFDKLIEFRQAVYDHGLTLAKDVQFELVDALLLSPPIRSFSELSLSPVFRREWPSVYTAIEDGGQNQAWLQTHFVEQIPEQGPRKFSLDDTAWLHPAAQSPANRQYICSATLLLCVVSSPPPSRFNLAGMPGRESCQACSCATTPPIPTAAH